MEAVQDKSICEVVIAVAVRLVGTVGVSDIGALVIDMLAFPDTCPSAS